MAVANVVVIPDGSWPAADAVAEVAGRGVPVFSPELADVPADLPANLADSRRVALLAQWVKRNLPTGAVVWVAHGDTARLLPGLSFAQRAAHRTVVGYVLVDAVSPAPSLEWPDAPVTWIRTSQAADEVGQGALSAELRGFRVVATDDLAGVIQTVATIG